jgi:hypothetical protein
MVDLNMSNAKLRRRGLRILREATGAGAADAKRALAKSGSLRVALMMLKTGASASEARRRLQQTGGNLWQALAAHSGTSVQPSGAKRSIEAGLPKTSLQKTGLRKPGLGKPDLQKPDLRGKA